MEQLRSYWRVGVVVLAACAVSWQDLAAEEVYCLTEPSGCCDDFCLPCPAPVRPRSPWYFQADALILRRDVAGSTAAATRNTPTQTVLSTWDLDEPFKAGARCLIGRTWGGDSPLQIEVSYFALAPWDSRAALRDTTANTLGGQGNLFSPFTDFGNPPVEGLDYNNFVTIREFSYMDTLEINLRRLLPMPPDRLTTSFIFGFRYMGIREQFDYYSESEVPVPLGATNAVSTRTNNEMYGVQIGGLFEFYCEHQWWVNFEIKGALCNNAARQQTLYTIGDLGGPLDDFLGSRTKNSTAFIGDLALTFVCRPTNRLTARVGYQAMWIEGVALAAENFRPDVNLLTLGPAQLTSRGSVVYHGPHAGLELVW